MRSVYMAYPMTDPGAGVDSLRELAQHLRRTRKLRVVEPSYPVFTESIAERAITALDEASIVIADVTNPSHGVGFELGYAHAKRKRIIVIAREGGKHRLSAFITTLFPEVIYYTSTADLVQQVVALLSRKKTPAISVPITNARKAAQE